jgi:hypothetical protein
MNTKVRVAEHLPFEEIERRYRKAKDGVARGRWQVIWLIAQGISAQHVADMTGYCYTWVRTLVQRYNQDGPEAMSDGRHQNLGGQYLLSAEQQQQLQEALEHDPPDGGLCQDPRLPLGSPSRRGARSIPSWAGSIFVASISANGCCVLAMPKPTHTPRTPLKKTEPGCEADPKKTSSSQRRSLGDGRTSHWPQTDPAQGLGAQRVSSLYPRPAAL